MYRAAHEIDRAEKLESANGQRRGIAHEEPPAVRQCGSKTSEERMRSCPARPASR
jgi:hypothetical protein